MARRAAPRPAGLPRPKAKNNGSAGYDPVGAIAAIFAGTDANPADLSKPFRRRRSSSSGASDCGEAELGAGLSHASHEHIATKEKGREITGIKLETVEVAVQTELVGLVQSKCEGCVDSLQGRSHYSSTGLTCQDGMHMDLRPMIVQSTIAGPPSHNYSTVAPLAVCDASVQAENEQVAAVMVEVCTQVTPDSCDNAVQTIDAVESSVCAPDTRDNTVQTVISLEIPVDTLSQLSIQGNSLRPTATSEAQTEVCGSYACVDVGVQALVVATCLDVAVQAEKTSGQCEHCDAAQSKSTQECVRLRQQLEWAEQLHEQQESRLDEERQLRHQQAAVSSGSLEDNVPPVTVDATALGCSAERQENDRLNILLKEERDKTELLENMLRLSQEQISEQESALQSLEQLHVRFSEEQVNVIRQKRLLDDNKRTIERQQKQIEELQLLQNDGSKEELERMLQHALEEVASLREIVRQGSHENDGGKEELERLRQRALEEVANLQEIVRQGNHVSEREPGHSAERCTTERSPERAPGRSSSQPALTAALSRRGEDETSSALPSRTRTSSLPPVVGAHRAAIAPATQAKSQRTSLPFGATPLPPVPAPRTLRNTRIRTISDIGHG